MEGRDEIRHSSRDSPCEAALPEHVVEVASGLAPRRHLDVREADELLEGDPLSDCGMPLAHNADEAVGQQPAVQGYGRLQMLAIDPRFDTSTVGRVFRAAWVDIDDPDPALCEDGYGDDDDDDN